MKNIFKNEHREYCMDTRVNTHHHQKKFIRFRDSVFQLFLRCMRIRTTEQVVKLYVSLHNLYCTLCLLNISFTFFFSPLLFVKTVDSTKVNTRIYCVVKSRFIMRCIKKWKNKYAKNFSSIARTSLTGRILDETKIQRSHVLHVVTRMRNRKFRKRRAAI